MSAFRLHRGWCEPNGLVTDRVTLGRVIAAASAEDAMAAALAEGAFLCAEDANLAWLTDEGGALVWSLRMDDGDTVPSLQPRAR